MSHRPPLRFKIATEPEEFEQIHRLNYRTFVEEIPQHRPNEDGRLVDRFHEENTYIICLCGTRVVGMLAVRDRRPFSLDLKLPNLDSYLPPAKSICEIRLLAVEPEFRSGQVFRGLAVELARYALSKGYDLGIISGTTRQLKLYRHVGFIPFGPLVGEPGAQFQPMYMTRKEFERITLEVLGKEEILSAARHNGHIANFLPGPVNIREEVREAFSEPPVSHRGEAFIEEFQELKAQLCRIVNARNVEIFVGSGTLANDVIGAQLTLLDKPGLILANGEFGFRLADAAKRFRLNFKVFEAPYGQPFDYRELEKEVEARASELGWLWGVHCETSTGVLNDLGRLKRLAAHHGLKLCMDCISSIGVVPVDVEGLYLASGVSGKGLGSYPGLSMVFYNHEVQPAHQLPRYLDLGYYAAKDGIPFTHSSNLVRALRAALHHFESNPPYEKRASLSAWARERLRQMGFQVLASEECAAPAVITIVLPPAIRSYDVGSQLERAGFLVSYMSEYLLARNWIQICMMGECTKENLEALLDRIALECGVAEAHSPVV